METLQSLCDVVNGKRRRFFNVSPRAAELFKKWIADWHTASSLDEVLDEWEMGPVLNDHFSVWTSCEGKCVRAEARPRAPWDDNRREPYTLNDELLYLVLSFLSEPRCERLRLCPECEKGFVALRPQQKYCGSRCGRLAASRRAVGDAYTAKRTRRIKACRAAYVKYRELKVKPRESEAEWVLKVANRHLRDDEKLGGTNLQVNFITRNAKVIGIPKGEK